MDAHEAFTALELRVGRVTRAENNERARKPAYKLWIDFGAEVGSRTSSAQVASLYRPEDLVGKLVVCAMNLGTRNIAGFESQVLTLGINDSSGNVVLLQPERVVPPGGRVY